VVNFYFDCDLGLLHRIEVGSVVDVSDIRSSSIIRVEVSRVTLKIEAVCTSEKSATLPTYTWSKNPRANNVEN
jgi:hypothetical protein